MNDNDLKILIRRYFNGETSLKEEQLLRRLLSENPYTGIEEAEEARAVISFSMVAPTESTSRAHPRQKPLKKALIWRNCVAASVIVALMAIPITHTFNQSGECVAYVNGIKTEDIETVTAMMQTELGEMSMASGHIESDISAQWHEMANAFNSLN